MTIESSEVGIVSVNVGLPRIIGRQHGKPVLSGIAKQPVSGAWLDLDTLNLAGDRQADLAAHGGPDKAVYAYPIEHRNAWNTELGAAFTPAAFGENLTTSGWTEDDVRIGDVWAWGDARLQVSQPRAPCYKLGMITGRPEIVARFVDSGRTGWYLRVLTPGRVPLTTPILVIRRDPAGLTVRQAHVARLPGGASPVEMTALIRLPPLAEGWRRALRDRLARQP